MGDFRMTEVTCSVPDCPASFVPHYWGKIRADKAGWFLQKDGTSYCPDHVPGWVAGWRAKKSSTT